MKNILFITNHLQYSDGVSICLRNLVNELCEYYQVTIFCIYNYEKEFVDGIDKRVNIIKFFGFYKRGLRKVTELFLPFLARNVVFKSNYDIVISYCWGTPSVLISYLTKRKMLNNSKKVGFVHTYVPQQISYYSELDAIICISEDGKNAISRENNYFGKLIHIRNIYFDDQIVEKSNESCSLFDKDFFYQKYSFCTVSRISPEKGIDRFVNALVEFHSEFPNCIGVIVGDGPSYNDIKMLINENNATDYIIMVGSQTNPYPIMKRCEYFITPSYREGLSTSCVEASILGRKILSTNVSGAKEIIENPSIGIVCENTQEGIRKGLFDLIRIQVTSDAFSKSRNKWSAKLTMEQYIGFFENL